MVALGIQILRLSVSVLKKWTSAGKQALKETADERHRAMLSEFAYNMALSLIERRCYREDLPCNVVNPAMTSIVGMFKSLMFAFKLNNVI